MAFGLCTFLLSRRLVNLLGTLLLLGICCLALIFIPKDYSTAVMIVYLIGKSSTAVQFLLIYTITSEMYPTNLRSQALGFCSSIGNKIRLDLVLILIIIVMTKSHSLIEKVACLAWSPLLCQVWP